MAKNLKHVRALIENAKDANFPNEALKNEILEFAEKEGRGDVLWPLRVSLSGLESSPGPTELLYVLGREESLMRIDSALRKLSESS